MKKSKMIYAILLLFVASWAQAQQKFTMNGYIRDADTGEDLIAASVVEMSLRQGAVSNTYGFYSLTLEKGNHKIKFSYVGYADQILDVNLSKDQVIDIKLKSTNNMKEVEVVATKAEKLEDKTQMSKIDVPIETIKRIPALLGEVDVLKAIQLLPGVQSGGEGQNGLYVRGGSPDQNLILLDGVPVYNASHILGFFSVFNADAIKNVSLVKGGFPARYGGRLSSVIDISMKEGNNQKFQCEGSVGLISSKLSIQGPIIKDKTSFILSARRTYLDVLAKPFVALAQAGRAEKATVAAYFYDFNAKINHKINNNNRLFLSLYTGKDVLKIGLTDKSSNGDYTNINGGTDYGNITSALRWNWQINPKLFSNTTLTYSQYGFNTGLGFEQKSGNDINSLASLYKSGIKDVAVRYDVDYVPNPNNYIRTGLNFTNHAYNPGALQQKIKFEDVNLDTILGSKKSLGQEIDFYVEDDMRFGPFKANIGLHATGFQTATKFYPSIQPRIGLNYLLNNSVAVKASFATMSQFINLLTNESLSLPTDLWVPSTDRIKPQNSWQAAIGVAKTFHEEYEVSIEGYYKKMNNVLSYKPGADFLGLTNDWQDKVIQGKGEAYGAEFFIQKKAGKFNGWIGYTLSWNYRQFDGINGGKIFPFKYDRRHDIDVVLNYDFNKKWSISGAWVYGTGNAITIPTTSYQLPYSNFGGFENDDSSPYFGSIEQGSSKNAYRMSSYHRFDVNVEYHKKHRRNWESTLSFGAYNVYNRKNPYFVYLSSDQDLNTGASKRVFKQVSLFGFIIPSISYGFKF
jgi:hypothetical protein